MERQRQQEAYYPGPDAFSDDFSTGTATAVAEAQVSVIHGVYAHDLPLAGMTVGQARMEVSERLNIDPAAVAVLDGDEVPEHTVLVEGQVLNFVKRSGEKGAAG
jgi:hypothetical protein